MILVATSILIGSYVALLIVTLSSAEYRRGLEVWAKCHEYYAYLLALYVPIALDLSPIDFIFCALGYAALSAPSMTVIYLAVGLVVTFIYQIVRK